MDLGGTKIETALVSAEGRVLVKHRRATQPDQGPSRIVADIASCARDCLGEAGREAVALGVGVAGQVRPGTGIVQFAPNLRWHEIDLGTPLEKELGVPVIVANDVRAATMGEWQHGAARSAEHVVCLFLGTGVGGGVVSGGVLLEGASGTAGEIGHTTLVAGGRPCRCRNRGCLEAYVGGWAVAERAAEGARGDPLAAARVLALASPRGIHSDAVTRAAREGDPFAQRLLDETAAFLGAGLVGVVNAWNPHLLVLGGGMLEGAPGLLAGAESIVRAHALEAALGPLRMVPSELGRDAGVIGAAALARRTLGASL